MRPLVILNLKARIIDPFHNKAFQADEIFRSPCRQCHIDRGMEKLGAELFRTDCLICHRKGQIANPLELLKKVSEGELKASIGEGVPGTIMPGFSLKVGGPLTDSQLRSLIKYIKEI